MSRGSGASRNAPWTGVPLEQAGREHRREALVAHALRQGVRANLLHEAVLAGEAVGQAAVGEQGVAHVVDLAGADVLDQSRGEIGRARGLRRVVRHERDDGRGGRLRAEQGRDARRLRLHAGGDLVVERLERGAVGAGGRGARGQPALEAHVGLELRRKHVGVRRRAGELGLIDALRLLHAQAREREQDVRRRARIAQADLDPALDEALVDRVLAERLLRVIVTRVGRRIASDRVGRRDVGRRARRARSQRLLGLTQPRLELRPVARRGGSRAGRGRRGRRSGRGSGRGRGRRRSRRGAEGDETGLQVQDRAVEIVRGDRVRRRGLRVQARARADGRGETLVQALDLVGDLGVVGAASALLAQRVHARGRGLVRIVDRGVADRADEARERAHDDRDGLQLERLDLQVLVDHLLDGARDGHARVEHALLRVDRVLGLDERLQGREGLRRVDVDRQRRVRHPAEQEVQLGEGRVLRRGGRVAADARLVEPTLSPGGARRGVRLQARKDRAVVETHGLLRGAVGDDLLVELNREARLQSLHEVVVVGLLLVVLLNLQLAQLLGLELEAEDRRDRDSGDRDRRKPAEPGVGEADADVQAQPRLLEPVLLESAPCPRPPARGRRPRRRCASCASPARRRRRTRRRSRDRSAGGPRPETPAARSRRRRRRSRRWRRPPESWTSTSASRRRRAAVRRDRSSRCGTRGSRRRAPARPRDRAARSPPRPRPGPGLVRVGLALDVALGVDLLDLLIGGGGLDLVRVVGGLRSRVGSWPEAAVVRAIERSDKVPVSPPRAAWPRQFGLPSHRRSRSDGGGPARTLGSPVTPFPGSAPAGPPKRREAV